MSPIASLVYDYRDAIRRFSPPARRFLLATSLTFAAYGASAVLFNLYLLEGGFRESFVGQIVALGGLGMALTALPAFLLADRWGRRPCMVLGALIEGVSMLLRSIVLAPAAIAVGAFGCGVGQALFAIAAAPYLAEHSTARERTHLFSAFFVMELVAGMCGSAVAGWLPAWLAHLPAAMRPDLLMSYRITLVLAALVAAAGAIPMATIRGMHEALCQFTLESVNRASLQKLAPIGVEAILIGAGAGLVIPFMNLYFKSRFACSSAQIGTIFSIGQVTTAIAMILGPAIALRFGKLKTATAVQLLSLPFLVTLGAEKHLPIAIGAFLVRATLMQSGTPLIQTFVMETLPPSLRVWSSSVVNMMWNAGWALSATLSGFVIQRFGYDKPFYITAVLYAAAAVYFYLSFRGTAELPRTDVRLSEEAKGLRGEGLGTD
jgi:MFS family permease